MTDTDTTTDFERFNNERTAANAMRDELCFITGLLKLDSPEVSDRIQKALDKHKQERDQVWGF
jgi:hypothetical protein